MNAHSDVPRQLISHVARRLSELNTSVVFVGGMATDLLVTRIPSPQPRATKDIDLIVSTTTYTEYAQFEGRLRELGFAHDKTPGAPNCRWVVDGYLVDTMPVNSGPLGFVNKWYPEAVGSAVKITLDDNLMVRLISAPVFIATKLEAFADRGKGNYQGSSDIEDIITVIDGRAEIVEEIAEASAEVRAYLVEEFTRLLANGEFLYSISSHLMPDTASQAREKIVTTRMKQMAQHSQQERE